MKKLAGIFSLVAVLMVVAAEAGHAQAAGKTIWDGVYTEAQATRGQRTAQQNCGSCHSPATEWASPMFISSWAGRPILELKSHLQMTMPFDAPGKLTLAQYTDIVAYMLKLNNVPAGEAELPADEEGLGKITVTRKDS